MNAMTSAMTTRRRGPHEWIPPAATFADLPERFEMLRGGTLVEGRVAYETWGRLRDDASNVILVLPGLSADSHLAANAADARPGWWEGMVGPGRPIDTDHWFVVCVNSLGSCRGSSGPASLAPHTGRPYGLSFPAVTLEDVADASVWVLKHLGIEQVACLIGTSMGGMSALSLLERHPGVARTHISISAALSSPPFSVALRSLQREAVRNDPAWNNGDYAHGALPRMGMRTARKLGLLSYRSATEWDTRFGRRRVDTPQAPFALEFEVEAYMERNADQFVDQFDPNAYLYLSRAIDWFEIDDVVDGGFTPDLETALVLGVQSDLLFPIDRQGDVARHLERRAAAVEFVAVDSDHGHDSFLVDTAAFGEPVERFLNDLRINA